MSNTPVLHRVERARELLGGIGNRKFYELLNSGRLKAVKLDGGTFVHAEEIRRFTETLPGYVPARESEAA